MRRAAARVTRNVPNRLIRSVSHQRSGSSISRIEPIGPSTPAAWITPSHRPKRETSRSKRRSTSDASPTSAAIRSTLSSDALCVSSRAARSSPSLPRAQTNTLAPYERQLRADSRPRPMLPPVTSTVFPLSSICCFAIAIITKNGRCGGTHTQSGRATLRKRRSIRVRTRVRSSVDRIVVTGLWHLGCVTAACLAEHYDVVGHDHDHQTVKNLAAGIPPLFEPGLAELIGEWIRAERLRFTTSAADAGAAGVLWVAFDTPCG